PCAREWSGTGVRPRCGGRVELREPHTTLGDATHGWHLHQPSEAIPCRDAGVVPHEIQDVGRILGCRRRGVRTPVRLGIPNVQLDLAVEFRRHRSLVPVSDRRVVDDRPEITPAAYWLAEKLTTAALQFSGSTTTAPCRTELSHPTSRPPPPPTNT